MPFQYIFIKKIFVCFLYSVGSRNGNQLIGNFTKFYLKLQTGKTINEHFLAVFKENLVIFDNFRYILSKYLHKSSNSVILRKIT